ncbi:MAG: hypothetical protein JO142_15755 [Burkholderiales bacterium]|nr:hypothetical protein [Burkholderiales bacterium]
MDKTIARIDVPSYHGPDRRHAIRRSAIPQDEQEWRVLNIALFGGDQRGSFGRRASDTLFLADILH